MKQASGSPGTTLRAADAKRFREVYRRLYKAFGPQGWWPGETPFEVVVGAVLTQNTAWTNVERAIANLKRAKKLSPRGILNSSDRVLARLLRPSGYFNLKAKRLKSVVTWLSTRAGGDPLRLQGETLAPLRAELLGVYGVGAETADSILLYAAGQTVFVIDAYTKRIFARLGLARAGAGYEELRARFEAALPRDRALYNEYHALIVALGKDYCRPKTPRCPACPLRGMCGGKKECAD